MKIYIHTDLEGVTDLVRADQIPTDSEDYRRCCENLMLDLNAAVAGAFEGGATHVTVLDSHAGGGNFILDALDERAFNDTKPNGKWWGQLDESYDGTFFIGAHAMAGTINGLPPIALISVTTALATSFILAIPRLPHPMAMI